MVVVLLHHDEFLEEEETHSLEEDPFPMDVLEKEEEEEEDLQQPGALRLSDFLIYDRIFDSNFLHTNFH